MDEGWRVKVVMDVEGLVVEENDIRRSKDRDAGICFKGRGGATF